MDTWTDTFLKAIECAIQRAVQQPYEEYATQRANPNVNYSL